MCRPIPPLSVFLDDADAEISSASAEEISAFDLGLAAHAEWEKWEEEEGEMLPPPLGGVYRNRKISSIFREYEAALSGLCPIRAWEVEEDLYRAR